MRLRLARIAVALLGCATAAAHVALLPDMGARHGWAAAVLMAAVALHCAGSALHAAGLRRRRTTAHAAPAAACGGELPATLRRVTTPSGPRPCPRSLLHVHGCAAAMVLVHAALVLGLPGHAHAGGHGGGHGFGHDAGHSGGMLAILGLELALALCWAAGWARSRSLPAARGPAARVPAARVLAGRSPGRAGGWTGSGVSRGAGAAASRPARAAGGRS